MIAGRMKYRLRVFRPVVTLDKFHSEKLELVEWKTVWAERVKSTAYRHEEVGEHFPDHRAEYNVRIQHAIGENWEVEEIAGLRYIVVGVVRNPDRGMLTLVCERKNQ